MAHTLVSAHTKWGLGAEVWAASSDLRERTRVEYHEDTLRGLCDIAQNGENPNRGNGRETKKKKKKKDVSGGKALMPQCDIRCAYQRIAP